jgi:hypothetical protein
MAIKFRCCLPNSKVDRHLHVDLKPKTSSITYGIIKKNHKKILSIYCFEANVGMDQYVSIM